MNRMKEPIRTGRKLTYYEEFIWIPLWRFICYVIVYTTLLGCVFLALFGMIKIIKFLWYL